MIVQPEKYYIDRRLGIDVSLDKSYYLGKEWAGRGYEIEFLREAVINENGVFVEVENE